MGGIKSIGLAKMVFQTLAKHFGLPNKSMKPSLVKMTRFLFLNYYYCRGMVACLSSLSWHHHLSLQYGTLLHCRHNWNIPVSEPLSYYLWLHPVPHTTDYIDLSLWSLLTDNPSSFTSQVKPTAHLGPQEHWDPSFCVHTCTWISHLQLKH